MRPNRQNRLASGSLWTLFVIYTVIYASGNYVLHNVVSPDRFHHTWQTSLTAGVIFGGLMTLVTWFTRRRFKRVVGEEGSVDKMLALQIVIRKNELPSDPELLKMLPAYLDDQMKSTRRTRLLGSIEFAIFTILGLGLTLSDRSILFGFITVTFIAFGVFTVVSSRTKLAHIVQLQGELEKRS